MVQGKKQLNSKPKFAEVVIHFVYITETSPQQR